MPCTPGCGACCDPITVPEWAVQRAMAPGPTPNGSVGFIADWWEPVGHVPSDLGGFQVLLKCTHYDVENRTCTAYDDRPPVCKDYPFYGREPDPQASPGGRLVCGYQAELGRTVLPIVEVR